MLKKGLSFNVVLSEEQIEDIASVTVDKLRKDKGYWESLAMRYETDNKSLEKRIGVLNKTITTKVLLEERYKSRIIKLNEKNKELEEENKRLKIELGRSCE